MNDREVLCLSCRTVSAVLSIVSNIIIQSGFVYFYLLSEPPPGRTPHATRGFFHKFQLKIYFLFVIDT